MNVIQKGETSAQETGANAEAESIEVEVAYAKPSLQRILKISVTPGTSAREIIQLSGIRDIFPEIEAEPIVGIFSRKVSLDDTLENGDRLEIYRPLQADPKEVRRRKAEEQKNRSKMTAAKPALN
jgi:putative ubiquitin-RnfH superfamily antitoxin RatB of RatAB toxin-antitoxin module